MPREVVRSVQDIWRSGYEQLLQDARAEGSVLVLAEDDERRRHPRFIVRWKDIAVNSDESAILLDMSISGVSFRSISSYFSGRSVPLSLARVFTTEADVLACDRIAGSEDVPATQHRVRCCFQDEDQGLQFLTLMLELERIEQL